MSNSDDVRWKQRFSNYKSAFKQLNDAVSLSKQRELSDLEKQGLIQAFEYTHELAWNTMKDFLQYQGNFDVKGSRDATRGAFKIEIITAGDTWMQMIQARNITSHAYDKGTVEEIIATISKKYLPLFVDFKSKLDQLCQK